MRRCRRPSSCHLNWVQHLNFGTVGRIFPNTRPRDARAFISTESLSLSLAILSQKDSQEPLVKISEMSQPSSNLEMPTPWPFEFEDADVLLRASLPSAEDTSQPANVDFKVHRAILSLHSKFFATMFSLPQPSTASHPVTGARVQSTTSPDGLPIVPVHDRWVSIYRILIHCYGLDAVHSIPDGNIDDTRDLLVVAHKYEFDHIIPKLRPRLLPAWLSSKPLEVYLICCRFGFDQETREAARRAILLPELTTGVGLSPSEDFQVPGAGIWLWNLLSFRTRCIKAIEALKSESTEAWLNDQLAAVSFVNATSCATHRTWINDNRLVVNWLSSLISEFLQNMDICLLPTIDNSLPFMTSIVIKHVTPSCAACRAHMNDLGKFFELCIKPKIEKSIDAVRSCGI
jgi:hypothetical protein